MPFIRSTIFRLVKGLDVVASKLPPVGGFKPIKGSFSAIQELNEGRLRGEILVESQPLGPIPPESVTKRCALRQNDFQPWPVFWTRSDDARLVGKMLHWRDPQNRLCSEGVFHLHERRQLGEDRLFAQIAVPKPQILPGAWTSIASNWGNGGNYFHWMLDSLTRLHVREFLPEPTRILLPRGSHRFITETIEMLGLEDQAEFPATSCVQPERFYFCSATSMTGVWNPMGFNWLRQQFAPFRAPASAGSPVFLTRQGGARVPQNIGEIEQAFSRRGFAIVDCGKLSVREQIAVASAAPAIAGIHGAAMTNILWACPDTPVLEIFQPAYLNACYEQIAFQGNLAYSAIVLEGSDPLSRIQNWLEQV